VFIPPMLCTTLRDPRRSVRRHGERGIQSVLEARRQRGGVTSFLAFDSWRSTAAR
jgi:hypothetical protein